MGPKRLQLPDGTCCRVDFEEGLSIFRKGEVGGAPIYVVFISGPQALQVLLKPDTASQPWLRHWCSSSEHAPHGSRPGFRRSVAYILGKPHPTDTRTLQPPPSHTHINLHRRWMDVTERRNSRQDPSQRSHHRMADPNQLYTKTYIDFSDTTGNPYPHPATSREPDTLKTPTQGTQKDQTT